LEEYTKKVLLITKNLMFLPRIEAATGSLGKIKRITDNKNLEAELENSKILAVLIDLEDSQDMWKPILIELRTLLDNTTIFIAYGPHKNIELMAKAKKLGCDHVLAKSAFISKIRGILKSQVQ